MRELFVQELEEVTGGQPLPDIGVQTTMACCEEGPFDGCCWYGEAIKDLIRP
jgi:hypothetical protein